MFNETWQTKRERLWRSFVKLRETVEDTMTGEDLEARDALNRFYLEAFELRDWLLASDLDFAAKDAVGKLFGKPGKTAGTSIALAACADIANASKHLTLTATSYSTGSHAKVTHEDRAGVHDLPDLPGTAIDDVPRFGDYQWMWIISAGGKQYDALLLAEDAMRDWETYLVSQGLILLDPAGYHCGMNLDAPDTNQF
ncbi:MAG: hypothetical protein ACRDTV_24395 [Mycobacterium sp.]